MYRPVCLASCLLVALLVSACGSSSSTAPTAPPIPQYAGSWAGSYTITGCTQSGAFSVANLCSTLGAAPRYTFALSQSSRNVTGSFALGTIQFPSTGGSVGGDGSLGLNATYVDNASGIAIAVTWALNMPASAITGTVTQVWTASNAGQANVVGTISTAARTAVERPLLALSSRSLSQLVSDAGR
jgi:hypothetical protein